MRWWLMGAVLALGTVAWAQEAASPPREPAPACDAVLLGRADVEVEQTVWGSVIRLVARDPAAVEDIHEFARSLQACRPAGASGGAAPGPAPGSGPGEEPAR